MAKQTKPKAGKKIATLTHAGDKRRNIPTAEHQSLAQKAEDARPFAPVKHPRRYPLAEGETHPRNGGSDPQLIWGQANISLTPQQIKDLQENGGHLKIDDAQLVWRGKDKQDQDDLIIPTPPLYIQEKIHPKVIIDDLKVLSKGRSDAAEGAADLFGDFNGIEAGDSTEFYQHDQNWSNRMILGDSLQAMASLAERESMAGKVQCVYFDPPYGIKFNSNWQVSTKSRDVVDGKKTSLAREPEVVKAFRDTWSDSIHSYLGYIRDRLVAMRELLTESGSIFVQISDENVHTVRSVMDEVFGAENFISCINFRKKTMPLGSKFLEQMSDHIIWYAKNKKSAKSRSLHKKYDVSGLSYFKWIETSDKDRRQLSSEEISNHKLHPQGSSVYRLKHPSPLGYSESKKFVQEFEGGSFAAPGNGWGVDEEKLEILIKAGRVQKNGNTLNYVLFHRDNPYTKITNPWTDTTGPQSKTYVVQTGDEAIKRCILMTTDPGDLVLDPTCGSGTTATVAEQWGRRWITMDTSRVALALARARIMAARYPFYLLADSPDGREKEQELSGKFQSDSPTLEDIRQGFVYERAPHITIKSIVNNAEIDVIWEKYAPDMEIAKQKMNATLRENWNDWDIPRDADKGWNESTKQAHAEWWKLRVERQVAIDDSIARNAGEEKLFDCPVENKTKVRVAGPFTVEALTPHRIIADDQDELIDGDNPPPKANAEQAVFVQVVLDNLKTAGVQQGAKEDRITLDSIDGWPGSKYISAKAQYTVDGKTKTAGIFVGPEFASVSRSDLAGAANEAADAQCDVLIACGFNFDVQTSIVKNMGTLHIIKAKINPDLHMARDLKNTGAGNLFVVFGEPDIEIRMDGDTIIVTVNGVDVFDPKKGKVRSDGREGIAAWFIDTDYNQESFFVRHAYFLGANDPYKALKTTLKADIDEEAWATLNRAESRPFPRPSSGRFAVKVINHFGDEVMKVFEV